MSGRVHAEVELEGGYPWWFYVCGECHGNVNYLADECKHCHALLSWEGHTLPKPKKIYTGEHTEPAE